MTAIVLSVALLATSDKPAFKFPVQLEGDGYQAGAFDVGACIVSGQPTEATFRRLAKEGYTTVVCLRQQKELDDRQQVPFDEPALLKELGMNFVHIPIGEANPAKVKQFAETLDNAKGKVLLHCTIAWRATYMWMAYLVSDRGVSVDDAWKAGMSMSVTVNRTSLMLGQDVSFTPVPRKEGSRTPKQGRLSAKKSKLVITAPKAIHVPDPVTRQYYAMWDMGDILNASQPNEENLKEAYDLGARTIVNLRTPEEMERLKQSGFDEVAEAQKLGMKYVNVPISTWKTFTPAALDEIAKAFDEAEGRIYLHCLKAIRTSEVITPYLIKYQGVDPDEASKVGESMHGGDTFLQDFLGADFKVTLKEKN